MRNQQVNVGIIGLGTVGTGVARVLLQQRELLETRTQVLFNLKAISELDWEKERDIDLSTVKCTTNADELLNDPDIDVIVETIGGFEPAFSFVSKALKNRKHVVTANKALIATRGRELFEIAQENDVKILFEASVGGGFRLFKAFVRDLLLIILKEYMVF